MRRIYDPIPVPRSADRPAGPGYDVLSGQRTDGAMTLGRRGVAIVRRER
jgi:hypothetical protein